MLLLLSDDRDSEGGIERPVKNDNDQLFIHC